MIKFRVEWDMDGANYLHGVTDFNFKSQAQEAPGFNWGRVVGTLLVCYNIFIAEDRR